MDTYQQPDARGHFGIYGGSFVSDPLTHAINELKAAVLSAMAIDDNQIATTSTYSSNKIVSLLDALKTDILGGANAGMSTIAVLTGISSAEVFASSDPPPTWTFSDLRAVLEAWRSSR